MAVVVIVNNELPVPPAVKGTDVGFRAAVGTLAPEGDTLAAKLTGPVKPPVLVSVIVYVPEEAEATVRLVGRADMPKSGGGLTVTLTVAVCVKEPLEPVTVTL